MKEEGWKRGVGRGARKGGEACQEKGYESFGVDPGQEEALST